MKQRPGKFCGSCESRNRCGDEPEEIGSQRPWEYTDEEAILSDSWSDGLGLPKRGHARNDCHAHRECFGERSHSMTYDEIWAAEQAGIRTFEENRIARVKAAESEASKPKYANAYISFAEPKGY